MRKLFATLLLMLAVTLATETQAQTISYPFGDADEVTPTLVNDSLVTVETSNLVTYVDMTADTTVYIDVVATGIRTGALMYFEVTADGTNRTLKFSSGITAADETVTASKTSLYTFIYNDDDGVFKIISNKQID